VTLAEAVRVFKATQPELDAVSEARRANERAREVLKTHMREHRLSEYKGIVMTEQLVSGWDSDALRAELGDAAEKFRKLAPRCHFRLASRSNRRRKTT
jgi:ParB-like chromosome segregation protein Spo0J